MSERRTSCVARVAASCRRNEPRSAMSPSTSARGPDARFHMVGVPGELAAAQGRQPVLGPRPPALKGLGADDVLDILEPTAMNGEIAIGGLEERLELVEGERVGRRERAHDAQA